MCLFKPSRSSSSARPLAGILTLISSTRRMPFIDGGPTGPGQQNVPSPNILCLPSGGIFWKRSAGQKQAEQTPRSRDRVAGRRPKPSGEEIFRLGLPGPFLRPAARRLNCPPHQTSCRTYVHGLAAGLPGRPAVPLGAIYVMGKRG